MAGRHAHLRGLATAIHEISGLKLKTHFAADGFLPCIEQHEIITEIPRVARRALVSFLQKLKKMAKKGNAIGCCLNAESLPQLLRVN
jgi:hypothetical protein